jgi:hypothetical protein
MEITFSTRVLRFMGLSSTRNEGQTPAMVSPNVSQHHALAPALLVNKPQHVIF